jgi:CheY-like chemotaxis protein
MDFAIDPQYQVLLVDDDEVCTFVTRHVLERFPDFQRVDIFQDSLQALQFLEAGGTPTAPGSLSSYLLLIDLNLEQMDGLEFISQAQRILAGSNRPVHLCLLTSSVRDQDYERAAQAGVDHYLSKPLTAEKVERLLKEIKIKPAITTDFSQASSTGDGATSFHSSW